MLTVDCRLSLIGFIFDKYEDMPYGGNVTAIGKLKSLPVLGSFSIDKNSKFVCW
jgi:hypothetical protein